MHLKDGDGAGTMPFLKSKNSVDHVFQYGIIPLKLTEKVEGEEEEVAWKNPAPNSARSLRPAYLIREVETDPDLLQLVVKDTDHARNHKSKRYRSHGWWRNCPCVMQHQGHNEGSKVQEVY